MKIIIPDLLKKNIINSFPDGNIWIENLGNLFEYCLKKYSAESYTFYPGLSFNFVSKIYIKGIPYVLKLSPSSEELKNETEAIKFMSDETAKIYDYEYSKGILLEECFEPGEKLDILNNNAKETEIAFKILKKINLKCDSENFKDIIYFKKYIYLAEKEFSNDRYFRKEYFEIAKKCFCTYEKNTQKYFLHGDFHHYNIVYDKIKGWKVIDPKGYVGEKEFDVAAYLRNNTVDTEKNTEERIKIFSLNNFYDAEKIINWGITQNIISAYWSYEDSGQIDYKTFSVIDILYGILKRRNKNERF